MNEKNFKCYDYPSIPAGTVLMYEEVDKSIGLSKIIQKHGLKIKGVPPKDLIKILVIGISQGYKSIKSIVNYAKKKDLFKYTNKDLDAVSLKNFYRIVDKLGQKKAKAIYDDFVEVFKRKFNMDFSRVNLDASTSYMEGQKCNLAKCGHSKDHRPKNKQIKIMATQCGKQMIFKDFEVYEGNRNDVDLFEEFYNDIKKKYPKGSIFILDKGFFSDKNKKLLRDKPNQHHYVIPDKIYVKTITKFKSINKNKMNKIDKNTYCSLEETKTKFGTTEYKYYFFDEKKYEMDIHKIKIKKDKKIELIKDEKKKILKKGYKNKKIKKVKIIDLEEVQIINTTEIQTRLINKSLKEIEKEFMEPKGDEGWFILTSSKKMKQKVILKKYRKKDSVEKMFMTLKQNCKIRPFNVRKDECIRGSALLSIIVSFVFGVFKMKHEELKNKTNTTILEMISDLTLVIKKNKKGNIIGKNFFGSTEIIKKLFFSSA